MMIIMMMMMISAIADLGLSTISEQKQNDAIKLYVLNVTKVAQADCLT